MNKGIKPLTCVDCGRRYTYERKKGHTKRRCNSCLVNNRRFKIKEKCIKYLGGCCQKCGYSNCNRALTFHHTHPAQKEFNISGAHARKWETLQKELDKCVLLCHNCHAEEHYKLGLLARSLRLG